MIQAQAIKKTMKAIWLLPAEATPFPWTLKEDPLPKVGENEVLVKIKATGLNFRDVPLVLDNPNRQPRPEIPAFIPGSDAAGVITQTGSGVTNWKVGDEVLINPMLLCGKCRFCLEGDHTNCVENKQIGTPTVHGTFREYISIPVTNITLKPHYLTWEEAAVIPQAFGTAWRSLITKAQVKPHETVLIHGVGGGVSLFALQIAVGMGSRVIVTSSSDNKLNKAKKLGAVVGINYEKEDVLEKVMEYTNNEGVDVVIDNVGTKSFLTSIKAIRNNGRVITNGGSSGSDIAFSLVDFVGKEAQLIASSMMTISDFEASIQFLNNKQIKPYIHSVYTLDQFEQAAKDLRSKERFGKVVMTVS